MIWYRVYILRSCRSAPILRKLSQPNSLNLVSDMNGTSSESQNRRELWVKRGVVHIQGPEHARHGDGRDGDDGNDDDRIRVGQVVHVVGIGVGTVEGATELTGQDGRVDEHEELEAAQDREGHDILGAAGVEGDADLEQDGEDEQRDVCRSLSSRSVKSPAWCVGRQRRTGCDGF